MYPDTGGIWQTLTTTASNTRVFFLHTFPFKTTRVYFSRDNSITQVYPAFNSCQQSMCKCVSPAQVAYPFSPACPFPLICHLSGRALRRAICRLYLLHAHCSDIKVRREVRAVPAWHGRQPLSLCARAILRTQARPFPSSIWPLLMWS